LGGEGFEVACCSNLTSQEMLKILMKATAGYIGRLDEILREAAIKSLSRGFKKIRPLA
jgi:hypothetical protein